MARGSALSAADKTGRVCRGVELDPLYVDVIVRRFEAATGNQAVLVETGETFGALATQGAGTAVGLRPAPAVADVVDEPPMNGRQLPVKRAGAGTAEVRGSNPGGHGRSRQKLLNGERPIIQCRYLGLTNDWAYRIIKAVGNYGESFERNVGMGSPPALRSSA